MTGPNNTQEFQPPYQDVSTPTDTTTPASSPLLFRDHDLMAGITALNSMTAGTANLHDVHFTDGEEEETETISFDPDEQQPAGDRPAAPAAPAPPTPAEIARMITDLDSPTWRTREAGQRNVEAAGVAALPQLLQAVANPPSLEVQRRAEQAIRRIAGNLSMDQLINLRDPAQRDRLINDGVTAPLNANDRARVVAGVDAAVSGQIAGRLGAPDWQRAMDYGFKSKFEQIPPTEETVRQFDRMATPEGRAQVNQRVQELTRLLTSGRLTDAERETVSQQLTEVGRLVSPQHIANERVNSRFALANHLSQVGGDPQRIQDLMLEGHRLSGNGNGQDGQRNGRGGALKMIMALGLDQNPQFMQRFQGQAREGEVEQLQQMRQQQQEWERQIREGGGKKNINN